MRRRTGTVKWFDSARGYGFVRPDDSRNDIFVHYSAIQMEGYRTLNQDERVEFEVVDTEKGRQAENVVVIEQRFPTLLAPGIPRG